ARSCIEWRMQSGVIFDMDGVLVDSGRAHQESWQSVGRELGRHISDEEFRSTFGRSSRDIIRILFGDEFRPEDVKRIDDRKESLYRDIVRGRMPVMAGAVELLRSLKQAGFRLAVGSSGPPENIALVLESLAVE